jgi:hypothetical protein
MTRSRRRPLALAVALALAAGSSLATPAAELVERFDRDPLAGASALHWFTEGDAATRFAYLADAPPSFPGDRPGALRVIYDTTLPTARLSTPLGAVLGADADVTFGAILTVRSDGFAADPFGFSQVAFGLWNGTTTGMGRTSFPADSYDLVEIDWFPNVTEFGGPFLSPTVFGGNVGDNAFSNFAFASRQVVLPFDTPILIEARLRAATATLEVRLFRAAGGTLFAEIADTAVDLNLGGLAPGFLVDVLGIAAYGEGWPSLRAVVDYDLVWSGALPAPFRTERSVQRPDAAAAD